MRKYLISFFEAFSYDQADAGYLLDAYDQILAQATSAKLLREIMETYANKEPLDYLAEILSRTEEISNITGLHKYTVDFVAFLCMSKHLQTRYHERGIDMQIYRDSVSDLKWKLQECKSVKGVCGAFVAPSFASIFKMERFALGRLQFELKTACCDYNKNGIFLENGKSAVINVHIPRTGTPLDKESCDNAYAAAKEFFKKRTGENCHFVCNSWLLYPENKEILPPNTNIYRFMSEYDIVDWGINEGQDLWRLFDTDEKDPDKLPADGSIRRCYVAHLKRGGCVGWGYGVRP